MADIDKKELFLMSLLGGSGIDLPINPNVTSKDSLLRLMSQSYKTRKVMQIEQQVAEGISARAQAIASTIGAMQTIITAGDRLKLEFKRMEYESKLLDLEEVNRRAEVKINISKADTAFYEAKITKLDYLRRAKEAKEEGLDFEDEDRD